MRLMPSIRGIVRERDPDLPLFNAAAMADLVEASAGRVRLAATVLSGFAVAAWFCRRASLPPMSV
jgi:hypothetical protein